jgi:serine/threonine protein kinase
MSNVLGQGAFAKVYVGFNEITNQKFAIKEISNETLAK